MTDQKPYRITRKYYHNDVIKTYTHDYGTLDKAYQAIITLINECDYYTFDRHRLVATKPDGSRVAAELRNQVKPCLIPIRELVESFQTDSKFRPEGVTQQ